MKSANRPYYFLFSVAVLVSFPAEAFAEDNVLRLDDQERYRCFNVLFAGINDDDFWPSIHAAEGLTAGGNADLVQEILEPRLARETDDQKRCGIARELVRAGSRRYSTVLFEILSGEDTHGHIHAAESLYKVAELGDGKAMRAAFAQSNNVRLKLMAAAALAKCGNPEAFAYLRTSVKHTDTDIAKLAIWIVGRLGDTSDLEAIRSRLQGVDDPVAKAFFAHSLAALGDEPARQALLDNLQSKDPAIRTYAATFAGDARLMSAADQLKKMLDDPHPDARYRAAHSLLTLAEPAAFDRAKDFSSLVYTATDTNPRYTEGSVAVLDDGTYLFAVTEFQGSGSDFSGAQIIGRKSEDRGMTWGRSRVLQANTGGLNVMSATLRLTGSGVKKRTLTLYYLQKNAFDDLDLLVRTSRNDGRTFGDATLITDSPGYHVVNNDRVVRLSTGRLIAPAASTADVREENHFVSSCFISDDSGKTWRRGKGVVDAPKRGAMEPEVIELKDGRLMMIIRTQLGYIGKSYSRDAGDTWTKMESLGVKAPEAPATIRRVPSTGDLLLIWNHTYTEGVGHGGQRTPLTAALSQDEGLTWKVVANLETDPHHTYSYTSAFFHGDRLLLSYWESGPDKGQLSCRFRSLPVSWLYR